jgi:hypothetical protein
MALTPQQLATLKADILARPELAPFVASGQDNAIASFYNEIAPGPVKGWMRAASARQIFEATNVNLYDGVPAGKRDAWRMLMDFAPVDFGQQNKRNAVSDVWSAQTLPQRQAVLQKLTEDCKRGEVLFGGPNETTDAITALKRDYVGAITDADVAQALRG